ncbi:MAG TPA: delta-60 repeat domain-containing protein, partial [Flavobacteriales bacterium]|nr:delta-60 repeat domain-containing protein [Flavobacteriales bacterium]
MMTTRSLFFVLALSSAAAEAQPGSLDASFGIGGRVIDNATAFGADDARAVAVQTDGRVLVAGTSGSEDAQDFIVARYLANGTPDPDFGSAGQVLTSISAGNDIACALAVQPDGRIVAAGYTYRPEGLSFAMVRYETDGTLDDQFGLNGFVVTALNDGVTMQALAIALQGDRIILAGGGIAGFAMVRYTSAGDIDDTFGTDGLATCSFTAGNDLANGIAFQQDGRIILAGYSSGNADSIAVARFSSEGVLDAGFGTNGRARAAGAGGSAIGRALVVDA